MLYAPDGKTSVGVRNRVKATRYVIAEGTFARFKPWDPT